MGKPNEREREILLLCFRKVQNSSKSTFPAKENTSQHQICPIEICLVFRAKTVPLSGLFCLVFRAHGQLYGLFRTAQKQLTGNRNPPRNLCPKFLDFCAKSVQLFGLYGIVLTVQIRTIRPPTVEKYFGQKFTEKSLSGIVPSLLLTFLSQACSENL
jgi:hypothetical protein